MKATEILRGEHQIICGVLGALEAVVNEANAKQKVDVESAQVALDFLSNFADRCHHTKEEEHFFPALARRGMPLDVGPLAVMLHDHEEGRALLRRMTASLNEVRQSDRRAETEFKTAALGYVTLMRDHIGKENGVLFPMSDGMLSDEEQSTIVAGFESIEHHDMEPEAHEHFLAIAYRLCERFGVAPVSLTTTGAGACCGHGSRCA